MERTKRAELGINFDEVETNPSRRRKSPVDESSYRNGNVLPVLDGVGRSAFMLEKRFGVMAEKVLTEN